MLRHGSAKKRREKNEKHPEGDISALRSEILGLKDEILKHALYEDGVSGSIWRI